MRGQEFGDVGPEDIIAREILGVGQLSMRLDRLEWEPPVLVASSQDSQSPVCFIHVVQRYPQGENVLISVLMDRHCMPAVTMRSCADLAMQLSDRGSKTNKDKHEEEKLST